jgi:hypothetical protein
MSNNIVPSIVNLPVELVYRICDCLGPYDILLSARGVCSKLNEIIDTSHPYQVNLVIVDDEDCGLKINLSTPSAILIPYHSYRWSMKSIGAVIRNRIY